MSVIIPVRNGEASIPRAARAASTPRRSKARPVRGDRRRQRLLDRTADVRAAQRRASGLRAGARTAPARAIAAPRRPVRACTRSRTPTASPTPGGSRRCSRASRSPHWSPETYASACASAPNAIERYEALWRFGQESWVRQGWAATANLLVHAEAFEAVGGFDPTWRHIGEDVDFCFRTRDAGYALGYCAGAIVEHDAEHELRPAARALLSPRLLRQSGALSSGCWLSRLARPGAGAVRRSRAARDRSVARRLRRPRVAAGWRAWRGSATRPGSPARFGPSWPRPLSFELALATRSSGSPQHQPAGDVDPHLYRVVHVADLVAPGAEPAARQDPRVPSATAESPPARRRARASGPDRRTRCPRRAPTRPGRPAITPAARSPASTRSSRPSAARASGRVRGLGHVRAIPRVSPSGHVRRRVLGEVRRPVEGAWFCGKYIHDLSSANGASYPTPTMKTPLCRSFGAAADQLWGGSRARPTSRSTGIVETSASYASSLAALERTARPGIHLDDFLAVADPSEYRSASRR